MSELENVKGAFSPKKLESIKRQLELYLETHREDILDFHRKEQVFWGRKIPLDAAVKLFILSQRTIDLQSEMADQVHAMKSHIEERSHCNDDERRALAASWVQNHSKTWRSLRVMGIIYVFNLHKDYFLGLLHRNGA